MGDHSMSKAEAVYELMAMARGGVYRGGKWKRCKSQRGRFASGGSIRRQIWKCGVCGVRGWDHAADD